MIVAVLVTALLSAAPCDPDGARTCELDSYCAPLGDGGVCTLGCEVPADCESDKVCAAGTCSSSCDATAPNTCDLGSHCVPSYFGGVCLPGCGATADCAASEVCLACDATCVPAGNDAGAPGSSCTTTADCPSGGECLPPDAGYPGGYCSQSCLGGCGCGDSATCLTGVGLCMENCSVSQGGPCRAGYVCDPRDHTDLGVCLPACHDDGDCEAFVQDGSCSLALGGACLPPGIAPPTLTSSSSGSSGSSTTSSSTSTGTSGTSGSSTTGSSAATTSTATSTSSASSSSAVSVSTSASAAVGTSGTSGTTSAPRGGGCGCGATPGSASGPELIALLALATLSRRRQG